MVIKWLVFVRNIYITCLIEELSTKIEYILYTRTKTTLNH
jgi:hypothetical protein